MTIYPLVLTPLLEPPEPGAAVGAVGGQRLITNGPWRGRTLRAVLDAEPDALLGQAHAAPDGGFPLLVTYVETRRNLPVRVHRPRADAAGDPDAVVLAWIVLAAEPRAVVYRGPAPGTRPETLAAAIRAGRLIDHLVPVPAPAGVCHAITRGELHGLGRGLVVAEIRRAADSTLEILDWERPDRAPHVDQVLESTDFDTPPPEAAPLPHPIQVGRLRTTPLVDSEWFVIERVEVAEGSKGVDAAVITDGRPIIWMLTRGSGHLRGGRVDVALAAGTTVLVPAALDHARATLAPGSSLLRVTPPSPLRGLIAAECL